MTSPFNVAEAAYRGAMISGDGLYRLWLWRAISTQVQRSCAWVLNNPSTADGIEDDPTVRRAWVFSRTWGYDGMIFVNVNPFRATDPKSAKTPPDVIQQANDEWLCEAMRVTQLVVCGWGDKANPGLAERAVHLMHSRGPLHALRVTKQGNPQHPLYLPGNLTPQPWRPEKWLH